MRQGDIKGTPHQPLNIPKTYWEHLSPWFGGSSIVGTLYEHCRKVFTRLFEEAARPSLLFFISVAPQTLPTLKLQLPKSLRQGFRGSHWTPSHPLSIWIALHKNTHNSSSNLPLWSSIWLSRFGAIGEHSSALLRRFLNTYSELLLQTHLNNRHRLASPAANCLLVTVDEWSRWRHDSHTSCWEGSLNTPRSLVPLRGRTRRVETTVPRALEALFAHWPVSCFLHQALRSSAFFGKQRLEREAYRPTKHNIKSHLISVEAAQWSTP